MNLLNNFQFPAQTLTLSGYWNLLSLFNVDFWCSHIKNSDDSHEVRN